MVGGVGYRNSESRAKTYAVFCSLNSNTVESIPVHVRTSFALEPGLFPAQPNCRTRCHQPVKASMHFTLGFANG